MHSHHVHCALLGGILIGLGLSLRLVFDGRSEGVSGMLAGLWHGAPHERFERAAFLLAMALAGLMLWMHAPSAFVNTTGRPLSTVALSGFCVGLGARLANGCTSGHGVLGMARQSLRSFVAILLFVVSAWVVVTVYPYAGGAL